MPHHVVVDGSNLATEGRAMPSLKQLNEAVLAFIAEHPDALITVVVDATFGHRIDASEVKEFDEAVANNELVAPPAGAIGRGDAFVLSIANKVRATILSNDSFQEFHGQYPWLFDEGRLVGGKPVPHIGWVFVNRVPVRGPVSRSAVKEAKRKGSGQSEGTAKAPSRRRGGRASAEASQPMPVPKAPPPNSKPAKPAVEPAAPTPAPAAAVTPSATVNDLLPFLDFVQHHPVGTSVNAVVSSYSSHGAYVAIGDVQGYVPLRLMADPAPRSAREVMKIGDAITLVVSSFAPARRSIELAVVGMVPTVPAAVAETDVVAAEVAAAEAAVAPAKKARAKKAAAKKAPAPTASEAPAKKAAGKKAPAEKVTATKTPAKKAAATSAPPAEPTPAETAPAEQAPAAKAPAKKAAARKAPTRATAATKAASGPDAGTSAPAKKSAAKKAATSAAKKTPAKKAAAKQATAMKADGGDAAAESGRRTTPAGRTRRTR